MSESELERQRLKRLRTHMAWSQREMATEFGVVPGAIALWETGRREVPGPIARLLDVYEDEFGLKTPNQTKLGGFPVSRMERGIGFSVAARDVMAEWLKYSFLRIVNSETAAPQLRQRANANMAIKLARKLGEMKGLGTKTIQMLSYFDFLLSEEERTVFADLIASSVTPISARKIAEIFVEDLGEPPRRLFANWSGVPFVTASIGQVHSAKLKSGERVVVKVQYPRIVEAIRSDIQNVGVLRHLMGFLLRSQDSGIILRELTEKLAGECDYRAEATNQEFFAELFRGRAGFVVPQIFRLFSNERILVSEYFAGKSFNEFRSTASQEQRNKAGEIIWQFAFESIFKHHVFNADPHPGNFLFGDGQVAFLDFGCVTHFSAHFIEHWKRAIRAVLANDLEAHNEAVFNLGIAPDPGRFDFAYQFNVSRRTYKGWLLDEPSVFNHDQLTKTWVDYFLKSPNRAFFNHSREWVFLTRLSWGLTFLLASLGARSNWRRKILPLIYS